MFTGRNLNSSHLKLLGSKSKVNTSAVLKLLLAWPSAPKQSPWWIPSTCEAQILALNQPATWPTDQSTKHVKGRFIKPRTHARQWTLFKASEQLLRFKDFLPPSCCWVADPTKTICKARWWFQAFQKYFNREMVIPCYSQFRQWSLK